MWTNKKKGEKMRKDDKQRNHLKIDDTLLNLIKDYHDIPSYEVISFFSDLSKQMRQLEGNIANKNKIRHTVGAYKNKWITTKVKDVDKKHYDYDAYALRGFYPGTKIPFKMTGVKQHDWGLTCWKVVIGNKDKNTNFRPSTLEKLQELMSEAILLDQVNEKEVEQIYKNKTFKCMRPKGMPLFKKSKI